jgi:hypothetical protein
MIPGQVSFTFDTWMSENRDPYLSVTGHYIDTLSDKPQQWELGSEQLTFTPFVGRHSGSNMGDILVCTINHYSLCRKVSSDVPVVLMSTQSTQASKFTADNAPNNDGVLRRFGEIVDPNEER